MRLKGETAQFVEDQLKGFVDSGVYERGTPPWGSWAFATKPPSRPGGPKQRVDIDYRAVNSRTVRAEYPLRRADGVKA